MSAAQPTRQPRLLLIHHEAALATALVDHLRRAGFLVRWVHPSRSALSQLLDGTNNVVVAGLAMPGCDGIEILTELKRASITPPLVLINRSDLSGLEHTSHIAVAYGYGPLRFVEGLSPTPTLSIAVEHTCWALLDEHPSAPRA